MTAQIATASASQKFWDRIAPKYSRQPIKNMEAYEAMLAVLFAELQGSDRILELGCGTGGTALRLAEKVAHVTATDISSAMIEIACSKLTGTAPKNVLFQQADAAELIAPQAFDAVFATSLLHLVDDVDLVLRSAFEQVKPGGLLITKTVCLKHTNAFIQALVPIMTWFGIAPKVLALSQTDLEEKITLAGFTIERIEHFDERQTNPFIVARRPLLLSL